MSSYSTIFKQISQFPVINIITDARRLERIERTHRRSVIAIDWNSTLQNEIAEICHSLGNLITPADFDRWDPPLGGRFNITNEAFTAWAWGNPRIQQRAKPYPGAVEATHRLSHFGDIWIVTATPNRDVCRGWLKRHGIEYSRVVFTNDKSSVGWDILIDDSPTGLERLHQAGRRVIRFHGPAWNSHLSHLPTLRNWGEWWRVVAELESAGVK